MYSSPLQVNEYKIKEAVEYPSRFAPLEITGSRLYAFGFRIEDANLYFKQYDWKNWGMYVLYYPDSEWTVSHGFIMERYELCGVKYVHQLQNLYFALSGEELTIKEDEKI